MINSFPPFIDNFLHNESLLHAQPDDAGGFTASVVVYRPDVPVLVQTLRSLGDACGALRRDRPSQRSHLYLIDNGGLPDIADVLAELAEKGVSSTVIAGHGNIGYGRGHNLAVESTRGRYHLILNPDIDIDRQALVNALRFFDAHPEVGLLAPRIDGEDKRLQYLCRRYPTLLDLWVRGFCPSRVRKLFDARMMRYEMRDVVNERDVVWDPPIISGCFMLFRTELLKSLAGFDPRYFLYFEDYDLSLRARQAARIAYVPDVRVLHYGGGAARKGGKHIRMFISSAFKFYNRFGWKWL